MQVILGRADMASRGSEGRGGESETQGATEIHLPFH